MQAQKGARVSIVWKQHETTTTTTTTLQTLQPFGDIDQC